MASEDDLIIDRRNPLSARCSWTIPDIKGKIKLRAVWSKYFDVGGYDCRLLVYPGGTQDPATAVMCRSGRPCSPGRYVPCRE